jgi:hypothetical protein
LGPAADRDGIGLPSRIVAACGLRRLNQRFSLAILIEYSMNGA